MIVCKFLLNPAVLNDRAIRVSKDLTTDVKNQSPHSEYANPRTLNSGFSGYLKGGKD